MASEPSPDVAQIKSVLEERARRLYSDWFSKNPDPGNWPDSRAAEVTEELNLAVRTSCPTAEGHKIIVLTLVTKQVCVQASLQKAGFFKQKIDQED